ncbi:cytochrome c oxidase assembly protein, partial [Streptomyces sp. SID625]|nr:cytochrome c oxidase assembly protein [Streptomyces sp. SID625]
GAGAAGAPAGPPSGTATPQETERVRPWWETEDNEVAARLRRQHGTP